MITNDQLVGGLIFVFFVIAMGAFLWLWPVLFITCLIGAASLALLGFGLLYLFAFGAELGEEFGPTIREWFKS